MTREPDPTTLVVIQARTGSTRLPGKVLMELAGTPLLAFQIGRLRELAAEPDTTVLVATSDQPGDDAIAQLAGDHDVAVVRGPESDVLRRFVVALDERPARTVVRLTADCPLTDPQIVRAVVRLHREAGADYTANVLPRSFPRGLDVEVMSARALRTADAEATAAPDREHVTPYLYRHPERFRLANLHSGLDLGEEPWTVDTADDLARVRTLVAGLDDPLAAPWTEILAEARRGGATAPDRVHLRPLPSPAPGSTPWVRTWAVVADGADVGEVSVHAAEGRHRRSFEVSAAWRAAAEDALAHLLEDDQQTR